MFEKYTPFDRDRRCLSLYNFLVGAPLSAEEHPSAPELNAENLSLCIENLILDKNNCSYRSNIYIRRTNVALIFIF